MQPHYRSSPDGNPYNNWSFPGNVNSHTGKVASVNPGTYLRNYYGRSGAPAPSTNFRIPNKDSLTVPNGEPRSEDYIRTYRKMHNLVTLVMAGNVSPVSFAPIRNAFLYLYPKTPSLVILGTAGSANEASIELVRRICRSAYAIRCTATDRNPRRKTSRDRSRIPWWSDQTQIQSQLHRGAPYT